MKKESPEENDLTEMQRVADAIYAASATWSPGELMSAAEFGILLRSIDCPNNNAGWLKGQLREGELMIFLGPVSWSTKWVKVLTKVGIVAVHSPFCLPVSV